MCYSIFRWKIRHGDDNLKSSLDDRRAKDFDIEKIFKHPKYNGTAYYDIAVLQIDRVKFSAFLRPGVNFINVLRSAFARTDT